jgi:hypothetical protein
MRAAGAEERELSRREPLSSASGEEEVGAWLEALAGVAAAEGSDGVAGFVAATVSAESPPAFADLPERGRCSEVLMGVLAGAERAPFHRETFRLLLGLGVLAAEDGTGADAALFLQRHRLAAGGCGVRRRRASPALAAMLEAGFPAGNPGPSYAREHPLAAAELVSACGEALAEARARAEAMRVLADCASRGAALDLGAFLAPCHGGGELLRQACMLRDQLEGGPHVFVP